MYTILHLETMHMFQALVREISAEIGARHFPATNPVEAFSILEKEPVSLILTAMELEGGSSAEFISKLNESEFRNIPVVVFTGNDSLEDRKTMYELGIVDYIQKQSGRDAVKQSLISYRKDDPVLSKMSELTYAVLDDSRIDSKVIARVFTMYGLKNVDFYESEKSLIESGKKYDIYMIDLILKETTGDKIIKKLRENDPTSVIIAISGIDNIKTVSRVLSLGADDYITKPFNNDFFMARLKTNIRNYLLIQETKQQSELFEKLSVTDSMTGLYNKKFIFERLTEEIEKMNRYGAPFSIVMFDIDLFKKVNDRHGHQFGDTVIKKVAEVINRTVRRIDIAGRYGGEEFLVIFPATDTEGALSVAERVRIGVQQIWENEPDLKVSVSGGIVNVREGDDVQSMIGRADDLLYRAKEKGRNNIQY